MKTAPAKRVDKRSVDSGLTKDLMHCIDLYIYNHMDSLCPDAFEVYNNWIEDCGIGGIGLETSTAALSYINSILELKRENLRRLLKDENFLGGED